MFSDTEEDRIHKSSTPSSARPSTPTSVAEEPLDTVMSMCIVHVTV